jgi:chemotaxis protein MotB
MSAKAGGVMLLTEGAPPLPVPVAKPDKGVKDAAEEARGQRRAKMRNMAQEIMAALSPLVKQGKVRVLETSRGITVEINDSVLFTSGEARLEDQSIDALWAVGQVLANYAFPVTIEGHTDDVPIKTERFPSNWELSAVRATSVLRLFAAAGVPAAHLTAIGYGQERPEASNATPEGRAKNRRVSILIDSAEPEAPPHVLSELTAKP